MGSCASCDIDKKSNRTIARKRSDSSDSWSDDEEIHSALSVNPHHQGINGKSPAMQTQFDFDELNQLEQKMSDQGQLTKSEYRKLIDLNLEMHKVESHNSEEKYNTHGINYNNNNQNLNAPNAIHGNNIQLSHTNSAVQAYECTQSVSGKIKDSDDDDSVNGK